MKKGVTIFLKNGEVKKYDLEDERIDLYHTKDEVTVMFHLSRTFKKKELLNIEMYERCDICNKELIKNQTHSCT